MAASRVPHTPELSGPGRSTVRPSLSALPGFRTHPDNASQERTHRQPPASSTPSAKMPSRRSRSAHQSVDLGNVMRSPREADLSSSGSFFNPFTSKVIPDRIDAKQHSRQSHGRSGSVASFVSAFAPKHAVSKRRASTSLLDDANPAPAASSSRTPAPRTASSATFDHDHSDAKSISTGSRHRRSRTGLRHGSVKILAWMDGAVSSPAPATGLGLEFEHKQHDSKHVEVPEALPGSLRGSKGLAKLKSFGIRPGFRRGWSETLLPNGSAEPEATLHPVSATRGGIDQSPGLNKPSVASKGMSRASSFLNLSLIGFSSARDRSISRQSSTASFRVADEPRTPSLSLRPTHVEVLPCNTSVADDALLFKAPSLPASASLSGLDGDSSIVIHDRTKKPARPAKAAASTVDRLGLFRRTPTPSQREPLHSESVAHEVSAPSFSPPTSPLLVERILPPEQIIDTLDRLRIVDPSGRARDMLGATGWSPLLDGGLAFSPSVRSSSESYAQGDAAGSTWEAPSSWKSNCSSPTLGSESICATPTSAWSNAPPARLPLLRGNSHDNQGSTRSSHVDPHNPNPRLRSLPAPPRKPKRRPHTASAETTATVCAESAHAVDKPLSPNPLSDISNQGSRADRSVSTELKHGKARAGPRPLRSPQRPRPRSTATVLYDQPAIVCVAPSPVL